MLTEKLIEYLSPFVSEHKKQLFDKLIELRTRYITVVLEDIYQPHNASAVLRTCDCFGIQDVHIIENLNKYNVNHDIAVGSSGWLTLYRYNKTTNNTSEAINTLKNNGYRIIAASPHINAVGSQQSAVGSQQNVALENFDLSQGKTALFFGTEMKGLSEDVIHNADGFIHIPMFGFTESFNISVAAAIILHHLTLMLRKSSIDWKLISEEKQLIRLEWLKNSIKKVDILINEFIKNNPK
ncbi:MAG: RNA methyltransferase [Bacteroidia bacterium]|nr:RNA methyltransferase [Bacteroidia bacterium]